jgi:diaminopimelate epimerase
VNLSNRKTGIGCDQLIIIDHSDIADCRIKIYNQDASIAEACGNATRCVAMLYKTKSIETKSGILTTDIISDQEVRVLMGKPTFYEAKPEFSLADNLINISYLSIGNPHLILIVKDLAKVDLVEIGTRINRDPYYKDGVNVSISQIINMHNIKSKTFERGVGITLSCGSGACASFLACNVNNMVGDYAIVSQDGGDLKIERENGNEVYNDCESRIRVEEREVDERSVHLVHEHRRTRCLTPPELDSQLVYMTGPVAYVYKGEII